MDLIFKNAVAVTASDTDNIPTPSAEDGLGNRGCFLYIGAAIANLKVLTKGGQEVTILAPAVGRILNLEVVKVFSTGSTAFGANQVIAMWR
jgi:hypothetical protein